MPAQAKPRLPLPPLPEDALKGWRFDDADWLNRPDLAPLGIRRVQPVAGWSGLALTFPAGTDALLALGETAADGSANLPLAGPASVRFWFAPDWTSTGAGGNGPGNPAGLVSAGVGPDAARPESWTLRTDPAGRNLRLLQRRGGIVTEVLRAPLEWCAGDWHQVALAWGPPGTVLYLDGAVPRPARRWRAGAASAWAMISRARIPPPASSMNCSPSPARSRRTRRRPTGS